MNISYLIPVVILVLALAMRSGYELLKEKGKVNPENKLVFAFIFLAMCALWASWFVLCPLDPYKINLPVPVRWSGFALFVVGIILAIGALFQLRGLENIDHFVTAGLFSSLRHPMYTGFVFWILGWSIYHSALVSLAVGLAGIANIFYWRRLEGARLLARYGDIYQQYQQATWF
jgi:protein-S-isoprenylcysteine O-methyltransferase Ste14